MSDDQPKKRGRGRPKGSVNKTSVATIEKITANGGQTPLEYLASIYQSDVYETKERIDAAKAAAPYCHSKLQAIEVRAALTEMSHEEWIKTLS